MTDHQQQPLQAPNRTEWVKHTLRHQKLVNGEWKTITTEYYRRRVGK